MMIVIFFFLNNMYVMKDKDIIVTRHRNYRDGLRDISVQKNTNKN